MELFNISFTHMSIFFIILFKVQKLYSEEIEQHYPNQAEF